MYIRQVPYFYSSFEEAHMIFIVMPAIVTISRVFELQMKLHQNDAIKSGLHAAYSS